jgi:hypothetical protein
MLNLGTQTPAGVSAGNLGPISRVEVPKEDPPPRRDEGFRPSRRKAVSDRMRRYWGCAPEGDGEGVGYIFNVGSAIIANVGSSLDHW